MKNKYTLINIYEIIRKSEYELKEDIINFGKESWPITRNMIWVTLLNLNTTNIVKKRNNKLSFLKTNLDFKKFKRLINNSYKNILNNFSKKKYLKECEIIFFSRGIYLEKLSSEKLFDRIIDPIYMTSLFNNKSLKIYIDNPILKYSLFYKGINYHPSKFYNNRIESDKNLEKSCILLLKSFIELNSLNHIENFLVSELKKSIKYYLVSKKKSKEFLGKFSSLKKIFITSWYFPDMMGIIASARQLGISTIEVQHGKQGKFQAAYSGWEVFPDEGFLNMPDNFWCWGNTSIQNILAGSPTRKFHRPILGGYAWPIWYKTYSKNNNYEYKKNNSNIKLLFTMQCKQEVLNNQPIPEGLLELIRYYDDLYKKTNKKIFEIKIRLHPTLINENLDYLRERLDKLFNSDLISYSSQLKGCFYDDLVWASHHLTFFSSCALEALLFGIKSAVYGREAYKIYEEEIKNKSITFLEYNSLEEMLNWVNEDISSTNSISNDVIQCISPDPDLINLL